jgi:nucleoside-diphosphate-sugar epimerase
MKVLVTGASGFVGSGFVERFRGRHGLELHGIGRRPLPRADYTSLDLSHPFDVPFTPDVVLHAAARASPWGTAAEFRRDNVDTTRNVLDFCRRRGLPRLVYVSSSSVFYRPGDQLGLTEESPIGPRFVNGYAATKHAGERLVQAYPGPWMIVRPRAVFGPGDTVLFPRIFRALRQGRLPLFVRDGPPAVGDLIYIDTLLDYLFAAVTRPDLTGCYNVTNNQPVELQAFLLDIFGRLGLPAPRRRVSVRTALLAAAALETVHGLLHLRGEPAITRFGVGVFAWSKTFDVQKALADLGPPSVPLANGVAAFVEWQRAQPS